MPIYEYICQSCSSKFEQLVRTMNGGDASAKCPECGSMKTARSLSVFAVGAEGGRSKSSAGASDVPICGRCGGPPGSCQM